MEKAVLIGDHLGDSFRKWSGGVLGHDGNIYGIPATASQILKFDPTTEKTSLIGKDLDPSFKRSGGITAGNVKDLVPYFKWSGGVVADNGIIYGIPSSALQVLRFDPRMKRQQWLERSIQKVTLNGPVAFWQRMAIFIALPITPVTF